MAYAKAAKVEVENIQVVQVGPNQWAVPSSSDKTVTYQVNAVNGELTCNCMAGLRSTFCKHKKAVSLVVDAQKLNEERRLSGESMVQQKATEGDEKNVKNTKSGYAFDEVTSALQKEIRKGDEDAALFWGLELYDVAMYYVWKRLEVIAAEDIGLAAPDVVCMVSQLHGGWELAKKTSWWVSPHQLSLAIILMCRAPKSTEVEDHQSYIMYKKKEGWKLKMPDYAVDGHTARGKAMGRGGDSWSDWYSFRHIMAKIPVNAWTRKLAEFKPEWFDDETLALMKVKRLGQTKMV